MGFHITDIATAAKCTACACDDNDLYIGIRFRFFESIFQFERHVHVESIQRGRIIEGNDSNSFCLFQSDHFVIHENLLIFLKQTYVISIITLKIRTAGMYQHRRHI